MPETLASSDILDGPQLQALRASGAAVPLRHADRPDGVTAILADLASLGPVRAVTANDACRHTLTGHFSAPQVSGSIGQVVGEIDLRLYLRDWRHAYAVDGTALHFLDAAGTPLLAVHATTPGALAALAARFADTAAPAPTFLPPPPPEAERPDAEVDVDGLRTAWRGLQYTHLFQAIPRRFGIGRAQAMRLAGPDLARPVPAAAMQAVLDTAAASALPIMVFVGNPGCVQIQSGPIAHVAADGPWLRILDLRFRLDLNRDRVASAWVVRKPSVNGDIHSLELFSADGTFACQLFGHRAAGGTERPDWRALLTGLPDA